MVRGVWMETKNYHKMSEEELTELCKKGDDKALQLLIKRLEGVISNCVSSFLDERFEREDLMQEGLVAAFGAILSYDSSKGAALNTYASVCIQNALKNFVKKKNNALLSADADFVPFGDEALGGNAAEDEYISSESYRNLRKSLKKILSETEYTVLSLFTQGMSYAEISQQTGQSVKGVDGTLQRIRKKLKTIL
ncbi:MAG: sigma-70 family RNA polymerase sigma factor [Ruminococcaceae bacterium]|nr:sigma-70 family RNA polymerase sigma factor [Oscillospiraceae bacterium]